MPEFTDEQIAQIKKEAGESAAEKATSSLLRRLGAKEESELKEKLAVLPDLEKKSKELEASKTKLEEDIAKKDKESGDLKKKLEDDLKTTQAERDSIKAKADIDRAALSVGFNDLEYGAHLYAKHVATLKDDEKAKAKPDSFFEELKKDEKNVHFFKADEKKKIDTGGNGGKDKPKDPPNNGVDVMAMTPAQFKAHVSGQGISTRGI